MLAGAPNVSRVDGRGRQLFNKARAQHGANHLPGRRRWQARKLDKMVVTGCGKRWDRAPHRSFLQASRRRQSTPRSSPCWRDEVASGPQIAEAMEWAPHTVRGFLAGLAKRDIYLEVLDRIRQIAPKRQGAGAGTAP
jgi:hypothetical protein